MIKNCILIHYHEIGLKGDNKSWFENVLLKNIRKKLNKTPYTSIEKNASRIFVFGIEISKWEIYSKLLSEVTGIKNALLVKSTDVDIDSINDISNSLISNVNNIYSFRISAKRQYKNFKFTSQEINEMVGAYILSNNKLINPINKPYNKYSIVCGIISFFHINLIILVPMNVINKNIIN